MSTHTGRPTNPSTRPSTPVSTTRTPLFRKARRPKQHIHSKRGPTCADATTGTELMSARPCAHVECICICGGCAIVALVAHALANNPSKRMRKHAKRSAPAAHMQTSLSIQHTDATSAHDNTKTSLRTRGNHKLRTPIGFANNGCAHCKGGGGGGAYLVALLGSWAGRSEPTSEVVQVVGWPLGVGWGHASHMVPRTPPALLRRYPQVPQHNKHAI